MHPNLQGFKLHYHFLESYCLKVHTPNKKIGAWISADLDVPQQEIFAHGLGSVVALSFSLKIIFCVTASLTHTQMSE